MSTGKLTPEAKGFIDDLDDFAEKQQYFDFINGTVFRKTLFCRQNLELNRDFDLEALDDLYVASQLSVVSENPDLHSNSVEKFEVTGSGNIQIEHPLTKVVLNFLSEIWGDSIQFSDLLSKSRDILVEKGFTTEDWENEYTISKSIFFELITSTDLIETYTFGRKLFKKIGEKPKLDQLARWQLTQGDHILGGHRTVIKIESDILRYLLENLDGKNSISDIQKNLAEMIESMPDVENKPAILDNLPANLETHLNQFSRSGLIVE